MRLRFGILLCICSSLLSCTEAIKTLESLGLLSGDFSVKQNNVVTTTIKVNQSTNLALFTVSCSSTMNELHIKYGSGAWTKIADINCATGSASVSYTVPTPIVVDSSTLDFPLVPFELKALGGDAETVSIALSFIKTTFNVGSLSVSIENGATMTGAMTVSVDLTAQLTAGALTFTPSEVMITSAAVCASGTWQAYSSLVSGVTLATANATNYLYVKFRDEAGNESSCISDSIDHDGDAPIATAFLINNNDPQTTTSGVSLALGAVGDVYQMYVSATSDCSTGGTWETYATTKTWTLGGPGLNVLSVKFRDTYGNLSSCISDSIIWDTSPPSTPTLLARGSGVAALANDNPVPIVVTPVIEGDTVKIYSDSSCLTMIASSVAGAGGSGTVNVPLSTDTAYTFWAKVTDIGGLNSACSTATVSYTLDSGGPTVASVTSISADGDYITGQSILIDVQLSESISVNTAGGSPTLEVNLNGTMGNATYVSQPTSDTLRFSYTVLDSHSEDDLDYSGTTALSLNGAIIQDVAGNDADFTLPAPGALGSLSQAKALTVNYNVSVASIVAPAAGNYYSSHTLTFLVRFTGPVVVTGSPILKVNIAGTNQDFTYSSTLSTSKELVFARTTAVANDLDGITTQFINLGAATIRNSFGANADLTFTSTNYPTIKTFAAVRPQPTLTGSATELVAENVGTVTVPVNIGTAQSEDVAVYYKISRNNTASSSDFSLVDGSLTIAAGATSGNITFNVTNDTTVEGVESFTLYLTGSSHSYLGSITEKHFFILDDDGGETVEQISAGTNHVCAVMSSGRLVCMGDNSYGQLGDGTTTDRSQLVTIFSSGVTRVSASLNSTCAVKSAQLYCWGENVNYKLGTGNMLNISSPYQHTALTDVLDVSLGAQNGCALYDAALRKVTCWGQNGYGQIGDNTFSTRTTVSSSFVALSNVSSFSTGYYHSCAISGTTLYCWGHNANGQIGDGTTTVRKVPTVATPPGGVVPAQVITYDFSTCMLSTVGQVYCWGSASNYKLGNGTAAPDLSSIPATSILSSVIELIGGGPSGYPCALQSSGDVRCWGYVSYGILGSTLNTTSSTTPTLLNFPTNGILSVSSNVMCAVADDDKNIFCSSGNVEVTTSSSRLMRTPTPLSNLSISKAMSGGKSTCALYQNGDMECTGDGSSGPSGDGLSSIRLHPVRVNNLGTVTDFVVNSYGSYGSACAIRSDNTLWCWGAGNDGQVGDGNLSTRLFPVFVMSNVTRIDSMDTGYCALTTTGALYCWGSNGSFGSVGIGTTVTYYNRPQLVFASGVTDFSAGKDGACAIHGGEVKCWGINANGEVGDASGLSQTSPVPIFDISSGVPEKVFRGQTHVCVKYTAGNLRCWGSGGNGKLGRGSTSSVPLPVDDTIASGVSAAALSSNNTCALLADATVKCWGYGQNYYNANSSTTNVLSPPSTPVLSSVTKLFASKSPYSYPFFALTSANVLYTWGPAMMYSPGYTTNVGGVALTP